MDLKQKQKQKQQQKTFWIKKKSSCSTPQLSRIMQFVWAWNGPCVYHVLSIMEQPRICSCIFKGVISNSNNILLWHESEDIQKKKKKKKKNTACFQNFTFSSYAWLCVFHCSHRILCGIRFLWNLLSFHTEMISLQPNSFGIMCFLEESFEKMQKIQLLTILRAPSIWNQGVCL